MSQFTDIKLLALAVLAGDEGAAVALADEVTAQFSQADYITRSELVRRIEHLEQRASSGLPPTGFEHMIGRQCYISGNGEAGAGLPRFGNSGVVIGILPESKVVVMNQSGTVGVYWMHEIS